MVAVVIDVLKRSIVKVSGIGGGCDSGGGGGGGGGGPVGRWLL